MGNVRSSYLYKVYTVDQLCQVVSQLELKIREFEKTHPYDAIAFRGTSGAAVAYPLSIRLSKPLICIRKDSAHNSARFEGWFGTENYIIVDDTISSGDTVREIMKEIMNAHHLCQVKPNCIGIFLYNEVGDREPWDGIPVVTVH